MFPKREMNTKHASGMFPKHEMNTKHVSGMFPKHEINVTFNHKGYLNSYKLIYVE
jgi:hypothetical protein